MPKPLRGNTCIECLGTFPHEDLVPAPSGIWHRRGTGFCPRCWDGLRKHLSAAQSKQEYLKKKYGLSYRDFTERLLFQGARCGICLKRGVALVVDHHHETGVVRGLLCGTCNSALGFLRDDAHLAMAAGQYLLHWERQLKDALTDASINGAESPGLSESGGNSEVGPSR